MKYTIVQTIQSEGNDPVEMPWAKRTNPLSAAATVATVIADAEETERRRADGTMWFAKFQPKLRTITITVEED